MSLGGGDVAVVPESCMLLAGGAGEGGVLWWCRVGRLPSCGRAWGFARRCRLRWSTGSPAKYFGGFCVSIMYFRCSGWHDIDRALVSKKRPDRTENDQEGLVNYARIRARGQLQQQQQ